MGKRCDLEWRLEAYFATLHSSQVKEALKRSLANWPIYAAVSGSAMAMITSATASIVNSGVRSIRPETIASFRTSRDHFAEFRKIAAISAVNFSQPPADAPQASQAQLGLAVRSEAIMTVVLGIRGVAWGIWR